MELSIIILHYDSLRNGRINKRTNDYGKGIVEINIANNTYVLLTANGTDYQQGRLSLTSGGYSNDTNEVVPAHAIWYSWGHGVRLDLIAPVNKTESANVVSRDLNPNLIYTAVGSLVMECQYTLGASSNSGLNIGTLYDNALNKAGEGQSLHWKMNAFHAYIGKTSRLKCETKVYDHTETHDSWRSWDDVWASF
ncbi:hypothetical protein HYPBUDRAFT_145857 [Hyphopichia burtonii NRRL Y-1933]|uniref:Uncharacterized protein n=1 Tax=Hyphopichia burtonii NRRL Y-1933 TaxID=984485 RepID=A0A1E4RQ88_9ASCO|nr:hypothetical protein HYPBUDRAFT_145857 [Hyphopichia burtonii NRRL Y-1933]ODV69439.1 hypothetical protein HYPBUDRAFT_145857 [Hyphopichia burtonii NRRL Y-1933]